MFLGTGSLMGREDVGVAIMRQCMEDMKRKLEATQVKL